VGGKKAIVIIGWCGNWTIEKIWRKSGKSVNSKVGEGGKKVNYTLLVGGKEKSLNGMYFL